MLRRKLIMMAMLGGIPVNENLTIISAVLKASQVVSGKSAILTVTATSEAKTIVVTDAAGNAVTPARLQSTVVDGNIRFFFVWIVTGSRGDSFNYTIRAYDADGLASVNTRDVTVTIK